MVGKGMFGVLLKPKHTINKKSSDISRGWNLPGFLTGNSRPGNRGKPGIFLQIFFAENCFQGHNSSRNATKKIHFGQKDIAETPNFV